jgi:hypothetical protein
MSTTLAVQWHYPQCRKTFGRYVQAFTTSFGAGVKPMLLLQNFIPYRDYMTLNKPLSALGTLTLPGLPIK